MLSKDRNITDYYPFGLEHKGYNNVVSSNSNSVASKFKFQGQELEESLGLDMYEFDLRQYDPALGRFMTTDPYEQFMSPYVAMGNNPIVSFDPDGGNCIDVNGNSIACPDGAEYDQYRDNKDNHINILDEVVINSTPKEKSTEEECVSCLNGDKGKDERVKIFDIDEASSTKSVIGMAAAIALLDGPEGGPADIVAVNHLILGLATIGIIQAMEDSALNDINLLDTFAQDSSKNERHGDTNAESKVEKQVRELEEKIKNATGNLKKTLKRKLQKIKKTAAKNKKGETHTRNAKN